MYKALILCVAAAVLFLGCGVDEEPLRPRVGEAGKSKLETMSPEERVQATAAQDALAPDLFQRRAGESPADAEADYRACRLSLLEEPSFVNANGITRAIALAKCMSGKGWDVKPDAASGEGSGS